MDGLLLGSLEKGGGGGWSNVVCSRIVEFVFGRFFFFFFFLSGRFGLVFDFLPRRNGIRSERG